VDPAYPGFYLTYEPRYESDVELYNRYGTKIAEDEYKVYVYDKKVVFQNENYNLEWVWARYNYRESIALSGTLGDLKTSLEAITVDSTQLLDVTVEDTTRGVHGLSHRTPALLTTTIEYLKWGYVQVYNLHDARFRDSLLNTYDAAYGTILQAWAEDIRKRSKFGWEGVILDVDMWDPLYKRRNNAGLPHLFDARAGYWACSNPTDAEHYTYSDYTAYDGYCPNHTDKPLTFIGVAADQWHSGIGHGDDLKVTKLVAR